MRTDVEIYVEELDPSIPGVTVRDGHDKPREEWSQANAPSDKWAPVEAMPEPIDGVWGLDVQVLHDECALADDEVVRQHNTSEWGNEDTEAGDDSQEDSSVRARTYRKIRTGF